MPTLIIDHVSVSLYDRIQQQAKARHRTPTATVLEVLETAFPTTTPNFSEGPLPQTLFLTDEIGTPFDIPWPDGEFVVPIDIAESVPDPHDIPDME